jgi:[ribosomal protein S18]-alanine N-acetyltransferase
VTVVLREMRWWDIEPVMAIEQELFPDDAWSRGMFWSELAATRHPGATRYYVVAAAEAEEGEGEGEGEEGEKGRKGSQLIGYAGLAAVAGTGDVQTIAVAREQWGTGLGTRLLADLLRQADVFECHEVLLEVRVDNTRAQRLYQRFGFEPIGFRRGYYQPGNVDALIMRLTTEREQTTHGEQGMING